MLKSATVPPCGHDVEWPNAFCGSCWSLGLNWFKGPPPPASNFPFFPWGPFLDTFFNSFFHIVLGPNFLGVKSAQEASWSQHVRFGIPSWGPKSIKNRYFLRSKSQLILREPRKPKFHSRLSGAHILSFPGGAKTLPKSIENRSQELSILSLFFDTSKIASRTLPGRLLEIFFT